MPRDVGDIGFPIALHPRDPNTAWVFPMDGTDVWPRTCPGGKPAVYRTRDGGESVVAARPRVPGARVVHGVAAIDGGRCRAHASASISARRTARYGGASTKARVGVASPRICRTSIRSKSRNFDAIAMKVGIPSVLASYTAGARTRRSERRHGRRAVARSRCALSGHSFSHGQRSRTRCGRTCACSSIANRSSDLDRPLAPDDEVMILHALSGG